MEDRYGPPPEAVRNLLRFSLVKSEGQRLGIEAMDRRQGVLNVKFHKETRIDPMRLMEIVRETKDAQFTPAGVLRLPLDGAATPGAVLEFLEQRLGQLARE